MKTEDFLYDLPAAAIAQSAIEPRDAARLLDTRSMTDHTFADLPGLLLPGDLVIVNRTRVRRARLRGTRDTGGAVEVLLLRGLDAGRWEVLARPTRRLRPGVRIDFGGIAATVVTEPDAGRIVVHSEADLGAVAEELGEIPLPPYFHGSLADEERYQTVFADRLGSAAAPTAALHFTDRVVGGLEAGGVEVARVELEVGLDTFRPITAGLIEDHRMHSERIVVGEEVVSAITRTRAAGGRVVAIGTTVVRTLESAARSGELRPFVGATDLFITPGFEFKVVDLVVTNFHVPGSTLIVLVASLMGPRWHDVYQTALERGYRFLSFGDAMLVEVAR